MKKAELIEAVAAKSNASKSATAGMLNTLLEIITESVSRGQIVRIAGFGTFSVSHRKARTGCNPQTGQKITISARRTPRFKAGATLVSAVTGVRQEK
jgi:DNA-binding protein HU-beta